MGIWPNRVASRDWALSLQIGPEWVSSWTKLNAAVLLIERFLLSARPPLISVWPPVISSLAGDDKASQSIYFGLLLAARDYSYAKQWTPLLSAHRLWACPEPANPSQTQTVGASVEGSIEIRMDIPAS